MCVCLKLILGRRQLTYHISGNCTGQRWELYVLLGEAYGSGLPLGYLLIQSNGNGAPGAKTKFVREFLAHMKKNWKLCPIITLSDKDWTEINALLEEFPDAKHQLCFWHALRAIKTRLATLRRMPAPYDVDAAQAAYHWIDRNFVPVAQSKLSKVSWSAHHSRCQRLINTCVGTTRHVCSCQAHPTAHIPEEWSHRSDGGTK